MQRSHEPWRGARRCAAGFRIHQAAARHQPAVRAPRVCRWRSLLGGQPQQPRGDRGRDLPRAGQSPRTLACRYREDRAGLLPDRAARTTVPLRLDPYDAVFVVFRKPRRDAVAHGAGAGRDRVPTVEGAWDVGFQPDRGAPAKIALDQLASWSENADAGVKYFSGTGTYTKTVQAPADWFQTGARLWLDLGDVKNLARGVGQRQAAGHRLEGAVPGGCDRRVEARREQAGNQGDEPVGQPADRRPAARRARRSTPTPRSSSTARIRRCCPPGCWGRSK